MPSYTLSHLLDHDVQKGLLAAVPAERTATAAVLAHIAEFDVRQLYRDQACSSMFVYCVRELGYSEDGASKRLHAARAARQFPVLFEAVADGRLHLSGVCLLAPKLTAENVDELVAEASGRSKAEIEYLLAVRYPKPGTWAAVLTKSASSQEHEHAPGHVEGEPGPDASAEDRSTTLEGDLGALLAARSPAAVASSPHRRDRLTPMVMRVLWKRDGARCTFVGANGKRCNETRDLQLDHIISPNRGGDGSVDSVRLRCPAHNRHAAAHAESIPDAPIEARLRVALQSLAPPRARRIA